jgi:hypothetical protein
MRSQPEKLRDIMSRAIHHHYHGEGRSWGMHTYPERMQEAYDKGDWNRVLRSKDFCRSFWTRLFFATTLAAGVDPPVQTRTEQETTAWERHHAAIQEVENPIDYCYDHADEVD